MFIDLPEVQGFIATLLEQKRFNDAVANVVVGVHNTHRSPQFEHGYLHYPGLDRCMEQLAVEAEREADTSGAAGNAGPEGTTLVIATELYPVGGHSKVVADLLRELPQPTLVLTDLFGNYRKAPDQLNWIHDQNPRAAVIVLLQATLWGKCVELARLTQRLRPKNIVYLQHHQDAVAFVGTQANQGSRKTLVHHCDHNASIGSTLADVHHVDFTDELAAECAQVLKRPTQVLPLYVADQGCKRFSPPNGRSFSVVTSGTHIKFARGGPVALQAIARTVLSTVEGQFVHIGPLDADWIAEIREHLSSQGLDASRFMPMGPVPNLWQTLLQLDAHLYLGSAPAGGGRAAIEAQGCGYPVVFYRSDVAASTTLRVDSVYACKPLGWSTLEDLAQVLRSFAPLQPAYSAQARQLYETRYARGPFMRELQRLVSGD